MGRRFVVMLACVAVVMLVLVPSAFAIILSSITPSSGEAGTTVTCTIRGVFQVLSGAQTPTFSLINGTTTISGTTGAWNLVVATATFNLPGGAPAGLYTLRARQVTVALETADLANAFTVYRQPPVLTSIDPSTVVAGHGELTLTVHGNYFKASDNAFTGSSVRWNGAAVDTTFNSATQLTAVIPAAKLTTAGIAEVTVMNVTDGTTSEAKSFTITPPAPFLTSLTPTSVWAGYVKNDIVLSVIGGNFLAGAHIFLSGGEKTGTTFVSAAQLTVPLVAADISTPTTLTISVQNPPFPPGMPSTGALLLPVVAETTDPAVTISGADAAWHNSPVALSFSATDGQSGVQKLQYMAPPGVPAWTDGTSCTVPVTTQGALAISAQATDWCNLVGAASATVNIDTTQPTTDALNAVSVKRGKTASLRYRVSEPTNLSPSAKVVLKVMTAKGGRTVKTVTVSSATMNVTHSATFKVTFRKGAYRWYVYATDLAGNPQANVDKAKFTVK